MIPLTHVLVLSAILFSIGLCGLFIRRNIIVMFMCVELMLNAVNVAAVAFAMHSGSEHGLMLVFFVLIIAAAEAVVGLSIIMSIYKNFSSLDAEKADLMKW